MKRLRGNDGRITRRAGSPAKHILNNPQSSILNSQFSIRNPRDDGVKLFKRTIDSDYLVMQGSGHYAAIKSRIQPPCRRKGNKVTGKNLERETLKRSNIPTHSQQFPYRGRTAHSPVCDRNRNTPKTAGNQQDLEQN